MKPLRVGSKVYKGTRLCHVRAFVDDDQVVIRSWSRRKGWCYEVYDTGAFEQTEGGVALFCVKPYGPKIKIRSKAT